MGAIIVVGPINLRFTRSFIYLELTVEATLRLNISFMIYGRAIKNRMTSLCLASFINTRHTSRGYHIKYLVTIILIATKDNAAKNPTIIDVNDNGILSAETSSSNFDRLWSSSNHIDDEKDGNGNEHGGG